MRPILRPRPWLPPHRRAGAGFTMIELIVVLAVVGLLLSLAAPRYLDSLDRGRRHLRQQNLALMRQAIDQYHGDRGRYPDRLEDLVEKRYLRAIPIDPVTDRAEWQVVPPSGGAEGGVYDVQPPDHAEPGAGPARSP